MRVPDATAWLHQLRDGQCTAVELVEQHLARLDATHPRINAAVQVFREEALGQAQVPRPGPLSGLPFSIKETIGIAGERISAGSQRMIPYVFREDATVLARLRKAGAILIARGNVPELALAPETSNLRWGRSANPLDPRRTCGGSSGGDAALVASHSVAFGVGSDLLGSIRIPAAFCGIVGFRPASAAIPRTGTWPEINGAMSSWLALGPLARSVRDVRLLYSVMSATSLPPPAPPAGRLVLPRPFPLSIDDPPIARALAHAQRALASAGLAPETRDFHQVARLYEHIAPFLAAELGPMLQQALSARGGRSFSILGESWRQLRGRASVDPVLFRLLALMPLVRPRLPDSHGQLIQEYRNARTDVQALLGNDSVVLLPTMGLLAPRHGAMARHALRAGVTTTMTPMTFCNYLDLAAITIPAPAFRDACSGLVPGIMLACAPGAESLLLNAASVLEMALGSERGDVAA